MPSGKMNIDLKNLKKEQILAIVAVLVILVVGGIFAKNMLGGGAGATDPSMMPPDAASAGPGMPDPNAGAPGAPMAGAPAPAPSPDPAAAGQPAPAAEASTPAPAAPPPPDKNGMRQIKVFGSVGVSYPATWKIKPGAGNASAVFTDGNASFEVCSPDIKAENAKAIADSAVKKYTPGAAITAQGTEKVGAYDAYWYSVTVGGKVVRIVGVDAPTRVAIVQRVSGGSFATYKEKFAKMQSGMTF